MTGAEWAGLIAGVAGPAISAWSANRQSNANRQASTQMSEAEIAERKRQFDIEQRQKQAQAGVDATQLDPFTAQRSRQKQALLGALMQNYQPAQFTGSNFSGGLNFAPGAFSGIQGFFSPEAMAAQENAFNQTVRGASPTFMAAPPLGVGYSAGAAGNFAPGTGVQAPVEDPAASPGTASGKQSVIDSILANTGKKNNVGGKTLSGAASGALTGAQFGGPIGAGVGFVAGGIVAGIQARSNDTKEQREKLAQALNFPSLHHMNEALSALGPEGQELRRIGEGVIGRKDVGANAIWMEEVRRLLGGGQ